jgi:hypothetical protein
MSYATGLAGGNATDNPEVRPSTDLESVRDNLAGSASFAQEMNAMLAAVVIKLRGNLPSEPATKTVGLAAVPAGILGELREHQQMLSNQQSNALDLIQSIKNAI